MIVLRINTLAKGRSGIHPENLRKFINAFNADFLPFIPEQGTVGASGDLAPLSHLALGMLGEGLAWDRERGEWAAAEDVLGRLGLARVELEEKEGLALINGTQFMTAILANTLVRAEALFDSSIALYSLATEAFGVDRELFSA
jgi:histidine ammonia-lyase